MLNGMLLDGNYAANAAAIRDTAAAHPLLTVSHEERSAIAAMESGRMTPSDAAHLQDLMYRTGRDTDALGPTNPSAPGLTAFQMRGLATELRGRGAFSGSDEVNFRMSDLGDSRHWTTSVHRTDGSAAHADSWPSDEPGRGMGYGYVERGMDLTTTGTGGHFDSSFAADVTLRPDTVSLRSYGARAARPSVDGSTAGYVLDETHRLAPRATHIPDAPELRLFRDPDTGESQRYVSRELLDFARSSD